MSGIEMVQLTTHGTPGHMFYSSYGNITYLEWCKREAQRIQAQPGRMAQMRETSYGCAVYVNKII